jgi:hypothetical protein
VDLNASAKTPFVFSSNALKTEELTRLEPDLLDNKFYVRSIGLVHDETVQGDNDVLELVSVSGP